MRLLVIACYVLTVSLTLYAELVSARELPLNGSYKAAFPVDVTNVTAHSRSKRESNAMSDETRKEMLDSHNQYRSERKASDMLLMVYDKNIEVMAQEWADKCNFVHSSSADRDNKAGFPNLGENMAATTESFKPASTVKGWSDEIVHYNYDSRTCAPGEMCGHYTQVVWATSKAVGCGVRYCSPIMGPGWNGHFIVCRYGPAGNYRGQYPYSLGNPCSKCPDDAKYCINGLCSSTAEETPIGRGSTQSRTSWIGLMLMIVVHLIVIGKI